MNTKTRKPETPPSPARSRVASTVIAKPTSSGNVGTKDRFAPQMAGRAEEPTVVKKEIPILLDVLHQQINTLHVQVHELSNTLIPVMTVCPCQAQDEHPSANTQLGQQIVDQINDVERVLAMVRGIRSNLEL